MFPGQSEQVKEGLGITLAFQAGIDILGLVVLIGCEDETAFLILIDDEVGAGHIPFLEGMGGGQDEFVILLGDVAHVGLETLGYEGLGLAVIVVHEFSFSRSALIAIMIL
jgi:hypothetical protein